MQGFLHHLPGLRIKAVLARFQVSTGAGQFRYKSDTMYCRLWNKSKYLLVTNSRFLLNSDWFNKKNTVSNLGPKRLN